MTELKKYTDLIELLKTRYSCRDFNSESPVSVADVEKVVEAARLAQSAVNRQPWTFVAVTDMNVRKQILAKSRPAFMEAPVVLVACGHHDKSWHRPTDGKDHMDIDLSIAIENMCLAASTLGLGCCWVCSFDVVATRWALDLPDDVEPVALIPLGYPKTNNVPDKVRKPLDEILRWEKY